MNRQSYQKNSNGKVREFYRYNAWQKKPSNVDWRESLFTVFVSNLSKRDSRRALREAFSAYGRVVDVFILFQGTRPTTYASVRYKHESEMKNAIVFGRNRRIDGLVINVKKTDYGWKDRRKIFHIKTGSRRTADRSINLHLYEKKDSRLYKDVEWDKFFEVNYNVEIPEEDLEWLSRSVVGRLQDEMTIKMDANQIREEKNNFLDKAPLIAESWFEVWEEWNHSMAQREFDVWICMEEVPLQLWNEHFFKSMGD
ncbi:hypothetical protein DITRI_Ditri02bG0132100 [Diplodiscus trichospermus]